MTSQPARYPSLDGKRVLVTGGGSGIGEALVERFIAQGARVGFLDIQEAPSVALVERLSPDATHPPLFRRCDLTDIAALREVFAELIGALGGLDILVNNAANDDRHALEEVTPDYWDDRIAVNLRHVFFASQAVAPTMRRAGGGVILNFGSISWRVAVPNLAIYQTAKAGIEGLTRALARELGPDFIRVNAILPGAVETPRQERWMQPGDIETLYRNQCLRARLQPADVAALALFLASDDARLCTGHAYYVDAGWA